jgi:hypothetical protein
MNHNPIRSSSRNSEQREHDFTQRSAQQPRHNARQDDLAWQSEIEQVLSPYWAARTESDVHTGSR